MTEKTAQNDHAKAQQKYRESLRKAGYKRIELWLPPGTWLMLKPRLKRYGGHKRPGHSLAALLGNLRFKPMDAEKSPE